MNATDAPHPDRRLITKLTGRDCWQFLEKRTFGRVAVATAKYPAIFPVNYAVDERCLVFRMVDGAAPAVLRKDAHAAFEADAHDEVFAWSVCVVGTVHPVDDPEGIAHCDRLPLLRWIPVDDCVYYRVEPHKIDGHRIVRRLRADALVAIDAIPNG